jgi:hypothetical protein
MNCESVKKLSEDYAFGLLTDEESALVQTHLDSCVSCAESVREAQKFRASLACWDQIEPREGFAQKVAHNAWRGSYLPFVRVCQAIAVAASLLAAITIYFHSFAGTAALQPQVQGIAPHITTCTGVLQDVSEIEVEFPASAQPDSVYIFLRFFPRENQILSVRVEVNGRTVGDFCRLPGSGGQPPVPCAYLISRQSGIKMGKNNIIVRNMAHSAIRYELIGCCDIISSR